MPDFPVLHCFPEFAQIHAHWVSDDIQPSHPLSSPSPPVLILSQPQSLSSEWVLWPAQLVGIKSGWCTVWGKKKPRDRIKVLKMGLGDSRPLGSRTLFLGATSLLFSVLASRKYLLCYDEVSLLCPPSSLPYYWLLWTIFVIFLYKRYHLPKGHRPTYALGKHLSVCTSSVLNLHWPSIPRSTLCFSLA